MAAGPVGAGAGAAGTGETNAVPYACTPETRRVTVVANRVVGGPHSDFVALFDVTDPWLRSAANGGKVLDARGADLRFTSEAASTTVLDHEIEQYDPAAGRLLAWLRVPALSASSSVYLQSGACANLLPPPSAAGVWKHYAAVWHLQDNRDSSAHAGALVEEGTIAHAAAKISGGRQFDGIRGALNAGSSDTLDDVFRDGGMISAWFKANGAGGDGSGRIIAKGEAVSIGDDGWNLSIDPHQDETVIFRHSLVGAIGLWGAARNATRFGGWHFVVVQYHALGSDDEPKFFVDGKASAGDSLGGLGLPDSDDGNDLLIGNSEDGDEAFNGVIDEVRMARVVHSPDWYATEFNNQSDPTSFFSLNALNL